MTEVSMFLKDVKALRELENEASLVSTPRAKETLDKAVKSEFKNIVDKYQNINSPEAEYLKSLKVHYGQSGDEKISLYTRIDDLNLKVREYNCLASVNIFYLGQLVQKTPNELLKIRNFGKRSVGEVEMLVADYGYELGMNVDFVHPDE